MSVVNPVKLIIENYPEDKEEWLETENNPEDENAGTREVPFSRELYIEREISWKKLRKILQINHWWRSKTKNLLTLLKITE